MRVEDLPTPAALVDLDRLAANARWALDRAESLSVRLRPHVKTHKSPEIGLLQCGGRPGPVTVSTFAEAWAFARRGFEDLLLAVPLPPRRTGEALALLREAPGAAFLVDQEEAAARLEAEAGRAGLCPAVHLKVDAGFHRAGVDPRRPESLAFGLRLSGSRHLRLRGILTHAGQVYGARNPHEAGEVARLERDTAVSFARDLEARGAGPLEVSVGSTPAFAAADHYRGVTEVRPGNYAFFDAFQAAVGTAGIERAAFTVLAEVTGVYPRRATAVVNAGSLALSRDPGPVHVDPRCGFGVVLDLAGSPLGNVKVLSLTQEHGVLGMEAAARLAPGDLVRIVPNHACLAAACFERYFAVRGGEVEAEWFPTRGW